MIALKNPASTVAFAAIFAASIACAQAPPALPPPIAPGGAEATRTAPPSRGAVPGVEPSVVVPTPAGAEARGGDAPPSRWQAELERLDADLRLRLLTTNEPRSAWLAGDLETTDIAAQVRQFTAARVAAPGERLYLASLGVACMQPVRPPLAECEAVDRLADWARRDGDNGVPMLLLAGRARQRGEADLAATFVEQAALAPRFDDYWSQGAAHWWAYLRAYDAGIEPAVRAKAALDYASMRDLAWAQPLRALCAEPGQRVPRMRIACASAGQALASRGATFALRRAGARIAEINAPDVSARATAQVRNARILAMTAGCAQATPDFAAALESSQPAQRATAIDQFAAWAAAQSEFGEVVACERLIAGARK